MKVGIIFPVINHLELTKAAIASIQSKHELHIVLVDNGSTDGTREWFTDPNQAGFRGHYIGNKANAGLTIAWNQGVSSCLENGCDYIFLPNNDVVFHPQTIDNLVQGLEEHPEWGLLSGVNDKGWCEEHGGPQAITGKPIPDEASYRPHPDFSCFMVRASLFDQLKAWEEKAAAEGRIKAEPNPGWFDENYSLIGKAFYEDNDFHFRLHRAGIWAGCTDRAPYYHYASMTAGSTGIGGGANSVYFATKFGGPPAVVFPH